MPKYTYTKENLLNYILNVQPGHWNLLVSMMKNLM